ncbi:arylsulfatase B-like isoform X1 [Pomacea canaliculata]|uniref:arylsulfatase B-like isoform X1 n=2 Tax=Pomacea canaliculata TaxID=400727 RepID=UPI000D737415|nr:arylsulfatase B-like isoform X1 [Pomacea canaliculata]
MKGSEMTIRIMHSPSLLLLIIMHIISGAVTSASLRPHIILIVADDLGYNDVSFHGSDQIPTPNIDRLAYTGVLLNNYYVSPICTPTRSALMTGRHPIHTGMQTGVIFGDQPYGLPLTEKLMPQFLNQLGYSSHIVGKWHLGMFAKEYTPLYRGFASHFGYYQGREDYYDHTYEANLDQWGLDFRRDMQVLYNYTGLYSTDLFTQEAVSIINRHNKSEPLFLYLPYQSVHSGNADSPNPLQAPQAYINRFPYIENMQRRIYAAMVSALDDAVGEVYNTLEANNMLNNSIIIFTTDNGGPANGFDNNAANNFPLRGVKTTLWEGGVRGVGLIHSPLLQTSGYVAQQLLHVCDWLPTLYEAAGGNVSHMANLDGISAWKMLNTNGAAVRSEILHNIDPVGKFAGIRVGDYKLVTGDIGHGYNDWYPPWQVKGDEHDLHVKIFQSDMHAGSIAPTERSLKSLSYSNLEAMNTMSVVRMQQKPDEQQRVMGYNPVQVECGPRPVNTSSNCQPSVSPCLFHIPSDPCEYNNLASTEPSIVAQLYQRLLEYSYGMVPPANQPADPQGNPRLHNGTWVPWVII